jgi:ferredoxin
MAYKVNTKVCLKCGLCIPRCPEKAFIEGKQIKESDGLVLHPVHIDPKLCTDCGVCVSEEWWCPAKAISKV